MSSEVRPLLTGSDVESSSSSTRPHSKNGSQSTEVASDELWSSFLRATKFIVVLFMLSFGAVFVVIYGTNASITDAEDDAFSNPYGNNQDPTTDVNSATLWSNAIPRSSASSTSLQFTLTRLGYNALDYFQENPSDILKYDHLADYYGIVEPYQIMHLEVFGDTESTVNKFRYTVCAANGGECQHGVKYDPDPGLAATISFECDPYDEYVINVTEYDSSGVETRSVTGFLLCQYVRREIRTMTVADLSATLDAMHTLWVIDDEEGTEMYGDDYHSASYLLNSHHFNAAWPDGDHIHEGNGFMTQHIKMTNIFEKSIQAVNPSVALPYWDFTMDNVENKTPLASAIMTETIFGSMTIPKTISMGFSSEDDLIIDGAIPDGRWAFLEADKNNDYMDLMSGYGYMRAPWNLNPSPYVSRFAYDYQIGISLPSCKTHYDILQYDSMMDFFVDIEDSPHATTHSLTGGIYGCDLMKPLLEAGYITSESSMKEICSKWVFYLKEFYRSSFITPEEDCEVEDDVQESQCRFVCNSATEANLKLDLQSKMLSFTGELSDEGITAWKDFVCSGDGSKIFSGDHLESASPADPSFWVIHPTLDRLLQAKLMTGGFEDETWATDAEDDYVCAKASCYEDSYDSKGYYADCCYGHYENDKMLDFVSGNRSAHIGWTNAEVVKALDPRASGSYSMEYVYDSFQWNHCTSQSSGYDFEALFETMYEEMHPEPSQPTVKPTHSPDYVKPTNHPTVTGYTHKPTHSPDYVKPTNHPTVTGYTHKPTHSPDYVKPTNHPTVTGYTHKPTHQPTQQKDEDATDTSAPTHKPTRTPTYSPTTAEEEPEPTHKPTRTPTYSPTTAEEEEPEPTHKPTRTPTFWPTISDGEVLSEADQTPGPTPKPSKSPKPTKKPTKSDD